MFPRLALRFLIWSLLFCRGLGIVEAQVDHARGDSIHLETVLKKLKSTHGILLVYETKLVAKRWVLGPVDFELPLPDLLQKILIPLGLQADHVQGKTYVIQVQPDQKVSNLTRKVPWEISGRVNISSDSPLVGAVVREVSGKVGTFTDQQGFFFLEIWPEPTTLVISHVGYAACTVAVTKSIELDIQLQQRHSSLDEVVVLGYGVRSKRDLTGAIASVPISPLRQYASGDLVNNLQGMVAGLLITPNSGAPGSDHLIRLRGIGSFANSNPLFVIDGFLTKDLSHISPEQIASVEVLKDASATAIYGSRGANGVVMVTTKRGKHTESQIELNSFIGVQQIWRTRRLLDVNTYSQAYLEAVSGQSFDPDAISSDAKRAWILDGLASRTAGTDWQNEIFRTGHTQGHSLQINGRDQSLDYALGVTFFDQKGVVQNTFGNRLLLHANLGYLVKPWLDLRTHYHLVRNQASDFNQNPYYGVIGTALRKDPLTPILDPVSGHWDRSGLTDLPNPARVAYEQQYQYSQNLRHLINLQAKVRFQPWLTLRSLIAADWNMRTGSNYTPTNTTVESQNLMNGQPIISESETNQVSRLRESEDQRQVWQTSHFLTLHQKMENHQWEGMMGMEMYQQGDEQHLLEANNVPEPDHLRYISLGKPDSIFIARDYTERYRLLSFFGRVFYQYDHRYLLTATLRFDGSSKFSRQNRWGAFPAFSLGWNLHEEASFPSWHKWSQLKLRASWGRIGNQEPIGPYDIFSLLQPNYQYAFDNQQLAPGLAQVKLANPNLIWESSEMLNIGLDMAWLEGRMGVSIDFFDKQTRDLLVPELPVPNFAGAIGPASNAAAMRNQGLELSAFGRHQWSAWRLSWETHLTWVTNQVTSLGTGSVIFGGQQEAKIGLPATRTAVGHPFATFWALSSDGIFQTQAEVESYLGPDGSPIQPLAQPGDLRFLDSNSDGRITEADAVPMGSALPKWALGSNLALSYRQFDVKASLYGTYGNKVSDILQYYLAGSSPLANNLTQYRYDNRWTRPGQVNAEPRLTDEETTNDLYSDRFIQDGSFVRLRNLQLGFTLPISWTQRWGIEQLRFYLSSDNLFTLTRYRGFDPEVGQPFNDPFAPGVDFGTYPIARKFVGGLNLTF